MIRHPAKAFTLTHLENGNLCASHASEVAIGCILSASEKLIMNTATTTPECQTLDIRMGPTITPTPHFRPGFPRKQAYSAPAPKPRPWNRLHPNRLHHLANIRP